MREIHSFIWVSDVRVKGGKHLARLFNSACWWAVNQAWAFDNMPDCTASHASVCPHKAAHDVTQNWSILINHWPFRGLHWHNSQLIIKIDGHCQKRCSRNNVFIALSFCPSVMYDLQNAEKHCQSWRRSPPLCKMNSLASAPDVQLVLTQLRILAGINHFGANLLAVFTAISEKRITCRM